MYQQRFYRDFLSSKFALQVSYCESDLYISTDKKIDSKQADMLLRKYYEIIATYVKTHPSFETALSFFDSDKDAPAIIQEMIRCSQYTGIGPFSSVAGAIALFVGNELFQYADEVIIENGGDIFAKINEDKIIGVYLGEGFSEKEIFLQVHKRKEAFGIASSSATIGHSLNFGCADLLTVIAKDSIIADGFATALSNRIKQKKDIEATIQYAEKNSAIDGLFIAFAGEIFLWGDLALAE